MKQDLYIRDYSVQQYQVPQFIDIEDRIIGPLTLKQFMYLLGAAAVALVGWFFLYIPLFILFAVPIIAVFTAMAFVKINGRPLPTILMNAINYYLKPRLYLWRQAKEKRQTGAQAQAPKTPALPGITKISESKLADLAWSLDIKEKIEREHK